jgi:hypothetical protein
MIGLAVLVFLVGCVFIAVGVGQLAGGNPDGGAIIVVGLVCFAAAALAERRR